MMTWSGFLYVFLPLWALVLDLLLGEPAKYHPLVGFGNLTVYIEKKMRRLKVSQCLAGGIGWTVLILPAIFIIYFVLLAVKEHFLLFFITNLLILYLTIGCKSLLLHAMAVFNARKDIKIARKMVSMLVSRHTESMDENQISSATIESVLENGNDAVIGTLFWFCVLGAPGAVLFRLANTLDAMWGYKNNTYREFGYVAAKMDDFLGYVPARLTAFFYALCGDVKQGIYCWNTQAKLCKSSNGGAAMCAGAGALNITIGGPAYYHGVYQEKIYMGVGKKANFMHIAKANRLVLLSSILCAFILSLLNTWAL